MPVITSDFSFCIDMFDQFRSRLVIRVLWYEFSVNSKVKYLAFSLLNYNLQISFIFLNLVDQGKPTLNFCYDSFLFSEWW